MRGTPAQDKMNKPFSLLSKTPGKEMEDYKLVFDTNLQFLLPLENSLLFFSVTVLVSSSSAESSRLPGLLREELIQFCLALKMLTLCRSELEGPAFFLFLLWLEKEQLKHSLTYQLLN